MSKFSRFPHFLPIRPADKRFAVTIAFVKIFNEFGISLINVKVKVADHRGFFQQSDFRHFLRIGA